MSTPMHMPQGWRVTRGRDVLALAYAPTPPKGSVAGGCSLWRWVRGSTGFTLNILSTFFVCSK